MGPAPGALTDGFDIEALLDQADIEMNAASVELDRAERREAILAGAADEAQAACDRIPSPSGIVKVRSLVANGINGRIVAPGDVLRLYPALAQTLTEAHLVELAQEPPLWWSVR